jgi:hypothetical protein
MLNKKRVTQIEVSVSPGQAALLWVRKDIQGKTLEEYDRWLSDQPLTVLPRIRLRRQMVAAVQAAMKGQDPVRIGQAARRARMETDFLILLVFGLNSAVQKHCGSEWLRVVSVFLGLAIRTRPNAKVSTDLDVELWEAATELFSIQLAVERIQARYFAGESVLFTDVKKALEFSTMYLRYFLGLEQAAEEDDHQELLIDPDECRKVVDDKASKKVLHICDLAKSEMLKSFGRVEEARRIMRPYILGSQ